jgi:hypothetical protein
MSGYYWARIGGMKMAADIKRMHRAKDVEYQASEVSREPDPDTGEIRVVRRAVTARSSCRISPRDRHLLAMRDSG